MMEDLDENGLGYDRVRATDVAAETVLAEYRRRNPDLIAARAEELGVPEFTMDMQLANMYAKNWSSEQILGRVMGLEETSAFLPAEYFVRGAVESVLPAATSMGGTRLALAATKLPFVPARYKPIAAAVGFFGGAIAGAIADLQTGASEKVNTMVFDEEEPLLPSDQIIADAFSMMGGFTTFTGFMRNQLKRIPGGIHPTESRGILPWMRRLFRGKGAAPLGEVAAPGASGVNFGANTLVNNVGKAPFRERALSFAERMAESAGTRARFPGRYWGTEAPVIGLAGAAAGAAELVDPGDPLTEFGFVAISSIFPSALATRISTGLAREFGKGAIHPIKTFQNLIRGTSERGAAMASKQVNAIYGPYLTRLEAPGKARLGEGATALARLRESGVSSEQLLPQLVSELTPKLTRGGVLAGEGAGFTPEQIQAAAENLVADRGYLPEIWSPDVNWSSQGTRQMEAAFIRSVAEADPDAHLLSPATTPGFDNADIIIPQVAALAKRTKGGDAYPMAELLQRSTWQYVRNNFEALRDGLNEGLDPSVLQAFAAGQKEANYQAIVKLADEYLSRSTRALERIPEEGGPGPSPVGAFDRSMTPERKSEIVLENFKTFSGRSRDVERIGWESLNKNGELYLPNTLKALDTLTVNSILSGRMEPGSEALKDIRDGLRLAGGVTGQDTSRLLGLKDRKRIQLANILDSKEGLSFTATNRLLSGIQRSLRAGDWARLFNLDDAVSLIFRPEEAAQIVGQARAYQEFAESFSQLQQLPKAPQVTRYRQTLHGTISPDFDAMEELTAVIGTVRGGKEVISPNYLRKQGGLKGFDAIQEIWEDQGILPTQPRTAPSIDKTNEIMDLLSNNGPIPTDPNYNDYLSWEDMADSYAKELSDLLSDFPDYKLPSALKALLRKKDSPISLLSESKETGPQLTNRFRTGAPIGEREAGSIPEKVGYGTALDLRSTMLARLREPKVPASERHLLTILEKAVLEDLEAAGLETGNQHLTQLTSYSKALNDFMERSFVGEAAASSKGKDEVLFLENLLQGSGTEKGASLQSVIESGHFLKTQTEKLLEVAKNSDNPELRELIPYLEEAMPQNKEELATVQNAIESYLRYLLVTNVIQEAPVASRMPSDVNRLLPERVSETEFFINPGALKAFQNQFGPAIANNSFLSILLGDLENASAANNFIKAFQNDRGLVAKRAREAQELATVLGVENGVRLVDKNMGSDTPIKALSDSLAVLNLMKNSTVMVPSVIEGTMVQAKTLYEDAVKGFKYSIWQWLLNQITDNSKREPSLVMDASGKAITQELPVLDAVKLLDLWDNTSKVIPKGRWTEGQSLGQVLVNAGLYTPEQNAVIRSTLGRIAEVQNRMTVFTDPTILAIAETGQAGKSGQAVRDFVARVFGAAGGAAVAKGAASIPGIPMGASSLVAAGAGSSLARNMFNDMPRTLLAEFFSEIYEPGNLEMFAEFLAREPGPQAGAAEELRNFMLKHGLITSPFYLIALQNYLREEYVEPTGRGTLIPGVREPIPPATPEEFVGAPPPQPTAQMLPPPQPMAAAQPPPPPSPASPAMRSQYAAAFPFDTASDVIRQQQAQAPAQQGIGSLV